LRPLKLLHPRGVCFINPIYGVLDCVVIIFSIPLCSNHTRSTNCSTLNWCSSKWDFSGAPKWTCSESHPSSLSNKKKPVRAER